MEPGRKFTGWSFHRDGDDVTIKLKRTVRVSDYEQSAETLASGFADSDTAILFADALKAFINGDVPLGLKAKD